jgi:hypothetical protein
MGQFALGIRSLLIKSTIFVVLAALLAWALGGTLFPRPETAKFEGVSFAGQRWFWKLSVGGRNDGEVRWELIKQSESGEPAVHDGRRWSEVAGPIVADGALYFAARASLNPAELWRIERVDGNGKIAEFPMPDRLAVEQQLSRLENGLGLQDQQTIRRQRRLVLDPEPEIADESR